MFWGAGYIIWAVVLYGLSSLPALPGIGISHIDKVEHAVYFAVGHFAFGMALVLKLEPNRRIQWLTIAAVVVVTAGIVGILDEWHQSFTRGRYGNDVGDILADTSGGIIASILLRPGWRRLSDFLSVNRPASG